MNEGRFTDSLLFKTLCVISLIGIITFILIFFKVILKPIALGILLWYMIKAFNGLIEKIKFRRKPINPWIRRGIALLTIIAIVEGSIEIFVSNIDDIILNYATYQSTLYGMIASLGHELGIENITEVIKTKINELNIQGFLRDLLASTSAAVGNLFLVIIYSIFITLEESSFAGKLAKIFNLPDQDGRTSRVLDQIYRSTNRYVMVKAIVSAITGAVCYLVLILIGVDFAFLWAMIIFGLNFIPYVGSAIATLLPAAFSVLQFGSPWPALWVMGIFVIIHTVIGNYIEPRVMGKSLNLSPLVVLIALSFWGSVWDLLGMLLSVPITSIILITLAQFPETRSFAILLTENGNIDELLTTDDPRRS